MPGPAPAPPRSPRTGLIVLLIALPLVLVIGLGVAMVTFVSSDKLISDGAGGVTLSVPRTWSNDTTPEAGQWIDEGGDSLRVPDLELSNFLGDRSVGVIVEPLGVGLAEVHQGDVDELCDFRACVDRGQPVPVEVNGRRGLEQVLAHAGAEWTLLVTLESDRYVVSVAAEAVEFAEAQDIEPLRTIARTLVING